MPSWSFYFDPHASGTAVFLGPTEARLMDLAWSKEELTVKQALFYLNKESNIAYTTVMTIMSRLADKKLLAREKSGRNFIYRPAIDKKTFIRQRLKTVRDCLKRNFKGIT